MSPLEVIFLGLLQGLTEFIPVSSSGHLVLAHELFGNNDSTLAFDVALHVGTLAALLIFFWKDVVGLVSNIGRKNREGRLARMIILATIPAALAGFFFEGVIDENLRSLEVVTVTMVTVAILMLLAEKYSKANRKEVNTSSALKIGFAQAAALVPGVSRSGATITAGLFSGLSRVEAARFSFLLAMPIIAGSALGVFLRDGNGGSGSLWELLLGGGAAFISGLLAIRFLMKYLTNHSLAVFAWYRFALAAFVLMIVILR